MRAREGRLALAGIIVVTTGGAAAAGEVAVTTSHYGFTGVSKSDIKASVSRNGPNGGTAWGQSIIDFAPEWRTEEQNGICRLTGVRVGLTVSMKLPQWRPGFGKPAIVPAHARRFMSGIERHENGHVAIARRYAAELTRRLSVLRSSDGCWPLRSMANAEREAIKPRHLAAHRAYDARTRMVLKALLN